MFDKILKSNQDLEEIPENSLPNIISKPNQSIKVIDKRTSDPSKRAPTPLTPTAQPKNLTKKTKKKMSFLRSILSPSTSLTPSSTPAPPLGANLHRLDESGELSVKDIKTRNEELLKMVQQKDEMIKDLRSELDIMKTAVNAISKNGIEKTIVNMKVSDHSNESGQNSPTNKSPQKREGISAEPNPVMPINKIDIKYFDKTPESTAIIMNALRENEFLKNLDKTQMEEIALCMSERTYEPNEVLIGEGENGSTLFVGAEGRFEVRKGKELMSVMMAGRCFGELALLYNCKRTASVISLQKSRVWALGRDVFQAIMMRTGLQRLEERRNFLKSIPLFKSVDDGNISKLADVLETQHHANNDCIIRQGELADSFYIIQSGTVMVTVKEGIKGEEVQLRTLTAGQYFGEKALLHEEKRTANCYAYNSNVKLLCLYKKDFTELVGTLQEIKEKNYPDELDLIKKNFGTDGPIEEDKINKVDAESPIPFTKTLPETPTPKKEIKPFIPGPIATLAKKNHPKFNPNDYNMIAILGVGGFGRVELVTKSSEPSKSYAMKRMRKSHIVKTKQQDHVLSEKNILFSIDCPFVCKLYATAKDDRFVYLLMEACLGGELWTILRDMRKSVGHLSEKHVKFSLACVILAFSYLHENGIIYRDLKPENLVVAQKGYLKLCDFGFAKYIGIGNKTWTFCGTPEYVAPEVILNKGHDFSADYWSLGILTCELLTGLPPFQASEPIKIYTKTLKGIDSLELNHHKYITLKAYNFIKKLCRQNPIERLGVGKNGPEDIRNHKYFHGFDWDSLSKRTLPSPFNYKVENPLDNSNFDKFPVTVLRSSVETSGWDLNF